jgi:hypothetical protein
MKTQFFGQNPTGWSLDSRYRYQLFPKLADFLSAGFSILLPSQTDDFLFSAASWPAIASPENP